MGPRAGTPAILWVSVNLLTPVVFAQTPVRSADILLAMSANARQIVNYEWKQRITVVRKGTPAAPVIDQIRFDSAGQMQRTTLSGPEQKDSHGIRGRIEADVRANVKDMMEVAGSYNKPGQMKKAVENAQILPAQTVGDDTTRLQAGSVVKPGDSMIILIDSATHLAKHVDITTEYDDGVPMTVAQDYSPIPGGPNVMKSMKVSVPKKDLVVNVDSYDYARLNASSR